MSYPRTGGLQDHPRVCGEQADFSNSRRRDCGSPPRVRGTVTRPVCPRRILRITPACAGNSYSVLNKTCKGGITPACAGNSCRTADIEKNLSDHPRVCGEQFNFTMLERHKSGSPPRVRGTVLLYAVVNFIPRITPACAGNS